MKNFWTSFLGAFAALWATAIIAGVLSFMVMIALIAASLSGGSQVQIKDHSVLALDLSGVVTDRPEPTDIYAQLTGEGGENIALNELLSAVRHAVTDDHIEGLYLDCGGASAGLAQAQAIIDVIGEFRAAGKWVWAYADTYTQGNYFIASAADSVLLNPIGMLELKGLSSTVMYYKGLMDKLGIEAQIVKVGTYKSAVEPYILDHMSDANRLQITEFLDALWNDISNTIAANRDMSADSIRVWASRYCFTLDPSSYVEAGLIDKLVYKHQVEEMLAKAVGADKFDDVNMISLGDYVALNNLPDYGKRSKSRKKIAVLYAVGEITEDGTTGIASETLVPEIQKLTDDEDLDGLILRVNSPGGSAYASEQIWEALEQFKKVTGKPFFVSMGDVAASGGYYISCGADKIFAEPLTLTGSIGIFGIIPNASKLLNDKLGLTTATVSTSGDQTLSLMEPMSPGMAAAMQSYVNRGYELFTSRCAEGRHISQDSIKAIGEGRVWDGAKALTIGLVDEMGSLDDAVHAMAANLGADSPESYYIREYPQQDFKWWQILLDQGSQLRASAIRSELGEFAPAYETLRSMRDMPLLQCRMELMDVR